MAPVFTNPQKKGLVMADTDREDGKLSVEEIIFKHGVSEQLQGSPEGLLEMVLPEDDPDNIGNHYVIKRKRLGGLKYTHHLLTVGIISNTYTEVVFQFMHYTADDNKAATAKELFSPKALIAGIRSLGVLILHTASVRKMRDEEGTLIGLKIEKDESGDTLKCCLEGKVSRVRNPFYPSRKQYKLDVVLRACTRVGEKAYDLLTSNCEHFVLSCLVGVAISSQAAERGFTAAAVDKLTQAHTYLAQGGSILLRCLASASEAFEMLPQMVGGDASKELFFALFSSGFDDVLEPLLSIAFVTGKDFVAIASRSGINGVCTAAIELIAVICQIAYDVYQYKHNQMTSTQVVRRLLTKLSGTVCAVLGTVVVGMVCGLLLTPFGLGPAGLIIGNIAGGVGGSIIGYCQGAKYLIGGRFEQHMSNKLESWITPVQSSTKVESITAADAA